MHEAGAVALTSWRASVGVSTVPKSGTRHHGPAQSNGMCLLELIVHWNLKPNASTEQIVDLPQVTSCPGPVSEPGAFMSCGYFPGGLVGPVKALAQAFTLPAISVPHWARSDAISKVIRALHAPELPAFGEQRSDDSRESSDLAAENAGKHLRLALVGALVDEDAGAPLGLPCPEVAFPSSHPDEAQTAEIDIAVMALPDVPEQHRLAEAVVRGLSERAGARDSAAAIVEPVSRDVPVGKLGHETSMKDTTTLAVGCGTGTELWRHPQSDELAPRHFLLKASHAISKK